MNKDATRDVVTIDDSSKFKMVLLAAYPRMHVMEWDGTRHPLYATIGGHEIGALRNGIVVGKGGTILGVYARIEEAAGPTHTRHRILIGTLHDSAENPDGTPCRYAIVNHNSGIGQKVVPSGGLEVRKSSAETQEPGGAMSEIERESLKLRFRPEVLKNCVG